MEKIRNKIIKDYHNILEMEAVEKTKIKINISPSFNIEGLIEDINEEYNLNIDYMIIEFNQLIIYIER